MARHSLPRDIALPVRSLAERTNNIVYWSEFEYGGHFAALEQPEVLVDDTRAFFGSMRSSMAALGGTPTGGPQ